MITQLKYRKIINVVLNKALPGLDTVESRIRALPVMARCLSCQ